MEIDFAERLGLAIGDRIVDLAAWLDLGLFEGFDRGAGLRSAVVRLGQARAILVAKLLHGITIPVWRCHRAIAPSVATSPV